MATKKERPTGPVRFPAMPGEAARYLEEERGIVVKPDTLRKWRQNGTARAARVEINTTLWTQEELDAIVPSSRTKMVASESANGGIEQGEEGESKGAGGSVLLSSSTAWTYVLAPEELPDLALAGRR
jgi:hypothetical protein